jgi:hypothetical protein
VPHARHGYGSLGTMYQARNAKIDRTTGSPLIDESTPAPGPGSAGSPEPRSQPSRHDVQGAGRRRRLRLRGAATLEGRWPLCGPGTDRSRCSRSGVRSSSTPSWQTQVCLRSKRMSRKDERLVPDNTQPSGNRFRPPQPPRGPKRDDQVARGPHWSRGGHGVVQPVLDPAVALVSTETPLPHDGPDRDGEPRGRAGASQIPARTDRFLPRRDPHSTSEVRHVKGPAAGRGGEAAASSARLHRSATGPGSGGREHGRRGSA